jgi:DNA mismatch repair protein MutL
VTATRSIQVLPDPVVARIAAGEVITRPRAAVKELVENAIDAGSTRIDIAIRAGGYDLIAVHDDGCGIRSTDAPLVFTRHATSKLTQLDGLETIATLGFRGEALASMAAVGDATIRTRRASEPVGTAITSTCDGAGVVRAVARQPGTSVELRDLFLRFPVRRGSGDPAAEGKAIRRLVGHFALAQPEIGFTLRSEERLALETPGSELRSAFGALNGYEALAHMLDLGPLRLADARIHGIVSAPSTHRGNRDGIVIAVNGRLCVVQELQRAVERAYAEVLPRHRYPHVALLVDVPANLVDVNVHPSKERVVLRQGRELAALLEAELRARLGRTAHLVGEKRSLALQVGDLPGLRAGEQGIAYAASGWGGRMVEAGSLPRLRIAGHVDDTLIVCECELGTLLVDQHRAHERVIYERLLAGEIVELEEPLPLTLTPGVMHLLDGHAEDLQRSGWSWSELGGLQIAVRACPAGISADDLIAIVERFARESEPSILAAAACHAAIRKRRPISPDGAAELLQALTMTSTPTTCPHGQPIVVNLDRTFLERQFGWR